jgi:nicotinate phosphoribosyltransferase
MAFLEAFEITDRAIEHLGSLGAFDRQQLEALRGLRFTGDVHAMPEGTVFFADEPLLEVTAPIVEAQLVETALLNLCHFQTLVASKAARAVVAARGRPVIEFGLRRAHGIDAGLKAARASYIAGAQQTSNVLAGATYGIRPTGTMAHSYVTAFPSELDAFRAFARAFPDHTILLIDTYDTASAAHKAVTVAQEMAARGKRLRGVRLDSGDLVALSTAVRKILDDAGFSEVRIFASGGLDEHEINRTVDAGAPIDAFGVGTKMDVSADAPYLDIAYKLVRYAERDVLKTSEGKKTWTGAKQVYRFRAPSGELSGDVVALRDEPALTREGAHRAPLLEPIMREGRRLAPAPALDAVRAHCHEQLAALPAPLRHLQAGATYPVEYSERLRALQKRVEGETLERESVSG